MKYSVKCVEIDEVISDSSFSRSVSMEKRIINLIIIKFNPNILARIAN